MAVVPPTPYLGPTVVRPKRREPYEPKPSRLRWIVGAAAAVAAVAVVGFILTRAGGGAIASAPPAAAAPPPRTPSDPIITAPAPADHGDLRIRVLSARVRKTSPKGAQMVIEVAITNTHPTLRYDDFEFLPNRARLRDNYGNNYNRFSHIDGLYEVVRQPLYPGQSLLIELEFENPVSLARSFELSMGVPDRRAETWQRITFRIPGSMLDAAH